MSVYKTLSNLLVAGALASPAYGQDIPVSLENYNLENQRDCNTGQKVPFVNTDLKLYAGSTPEIFELPDGEIAKCTTYRENLNDDDVHQVGLHKRPSGKWQYNLFDENGDRLYVRSASAFIEHAWVPNSLIGNGPGLINYTVSEDVTDSSLLTSGGTGYTPELSPIEGPKAQRPGTTDPQCRNATKREFANLTAEEIDWLETKPELLRADGSIYECTSKSFIPEYMGLYPDTDYQVALTSISPSTLEEEAQLGGFKVAKVIPGGPTGGTQTQVITFTDEEGNSGPRRSSYMMLTPSVRNDMETAVAAWDCNNAIYASISDLEGKLAETHIGELSEGGHIYDCTLDFAVADLHLEADTSLDSDDLVGTILGNETYEGYLVLKADGSPAKQAISEDPLVLDYIMIPKPMAPEFGLQVPEPAPVPVPQPVVVNPPAPEQVTPVTQTVDQYLLAGLGFNYNNDFKGTDGKIPFSTGTGFRGKGRLGSSVSDPEDLVVDIHSVHLDRLWNNGHPGHNWGNIQLDATGAYQRDLTDAVTGGLGLNLGVDSMSVKVGTINANLYRWALSAEAQGLFDLQPLDFETYASFGVGGRGTGINSTGLGNVRTSDFMTRSRLGAKTLGEISDTGLSLGAELQALGDFGQITDQGEVPYVQLRTGPLAQWTFGVDDQEILFEGGVETLLWNNGGLRNDNAINAATLQPHLSIGKRF